MFVHLVVYEFIYFMFYSVEYPLLPTKLYIFDSLRKITKLQIFLCFKCVLSDFFLIIVSGVELNRFLFCLKKYENRI